MQKKQLQFGSLNFVTGSSSAGSTGDSRNFLNSPKAPDSHKCNGVNKVDVVGDNLPVVSPKAFNSFPPSDSHKCNGVDRIVSGNLPVAGVSGAIRGKESIANPSLGPSLAIDVKEAKKDNASYATPFDIDGPLNQFINLKLDDSETGSPKHVDKKGSLDQDSKRASNGQVTLIKDLLPRGLINSGNLCFLNATVQALLSCSPFVQLLQELRTRKIPKVSYHYFLLLHLSRAALIQKFKLLGKGP